MTLRRSYDNDCNENNGYSRRRSLHPSSERRGGQPGIYIVDATVRDGAPYPEKLGDLIERAIAPLFRDRRGREGRARTAVDLTRVNGRYRITVRDKLYTVPPSAPAGGSEGKIISPI